MKRRLLVCTGLLLVLFALTGCPTTTGPTGPASAPILSEPVTVNPSPVNVGQTVIFSINFVDIPGDVNGGTATVFDSQNNIAYNNLPVTAPEATSGTLTIAMPLNPLVRSGSWLHSIIVYDRAGNPSNQVFPTVVVR
jgi:hypothetical protein